MENSGRSRFHRKLNGCWIFRRGERVEYATVADCRIDRLRYYALRPEWFDQAFTRPELDFAVLDCRRSELNRQK
jgi:hypothetical protein